MEDLGVVRRERDEQDRRHVTARITEAGRRLLETVTPELEAVERARFGRLSESALQAMITALAPCSRDRAEFSCSHICVITVTVTTSKEYLICLLDTLDIATLSAGLLVARLALGLAMAAHGSPEAPRLVRRLWPQGHGRVLRRPGLPSRACLRGGRLGE